MKMLIAVDGSDAASRAVRHAVKLAKSLKEAPEIHLLHADAPLLPDANKALGKDRVATYHAENARHATRRARALLKREKLEATEHFEVGDPATTILEVMRKQKCTLVVMGSHGRSALKSALLGSVTSKVLAHSATPVTIVR